MQRLTDSFAATGHSTKLLRSPSGEVGNNRFAKGYALGAHLLNARNHARGGGPNIVAWPLLGWWEAPLWQHAANCTYIVMHDPKPLAIQDGLSARAAKRSSRACRARWPHLVTMSPEAYTVTSEYFPEHRIHLVPHPMRTPRCDRQNPTGSVALVLGQYKPARDLRVMSSIAGALRADGWEPMVAGRGWPSIPGWRVVNRYLEKAEFDRLLASAAAVLLPYQHYFQSGVALRALEAGVPVVGRETGFLACVLGPNFSGAVADWHEPDSWAAAMSDAVASTSSQIKAATRYGKRGIFEWDSLVRSSVTRPR
ncbi:hypothetical protein Mycch_1306 [Mycolicibacterium chubuense NBB4]|uniref:Glycosyl transferases group 1 n=1 Tax=Mycolicibacterium chubuense (strain NBB4) TaxID=710421 RepID=I4BFQ1_MYCCN|nr:hypothetical protein Mycch_1306 [Mycolicibacterium chubuense NBB4]